MLKLTQFLLIYCIGESIAVKDIPDIKEKVSDSAARKNKLFLEKRAEKIDEVIDNITDFFVNPPTSMSMMRSHISASTCYSRVIQESMKLEDLFTLNDIEQILDMLVENNFLIKRPGAIISPTYYEFKKPKFDLN